MREMTVKCTAVGLLSLVGAYFEQIGGALAVLTITMVLDYLTGMVRAWMTATLSSKRGMRGILKKLSYFIVIASGAICDWILSQALSGAGISHPFPDLVSILVTVWLIVNELISILENLSAIGVPLPGFLTFLIDRLAVMGEQKGGMEEPMDDGEWEMLPFAEIYEEESREERGEESDEGR